MSDPRRYLAAVPRGLETVAATELKSLGAALCGQRSGSLWIDADLEVAFRLLLQSRTLLRLQELLFAGEVRNEDELYKVCRERPFERLLTERTTFRVEAVLEGESFGRENFAALRVKDAIVDRMREVTGTRPSVDRRHPDVPFKVWISRGELHVYRELSGESLHKRGYRDVQAKAPLNEALAAGLLLRTGWTPDRPLVDPMCGSATFLIEAAWLALGRPPGLTRSFALEKWPDVDPKLLKVWRDDARRAMRPRATSLRIAGADHHQGALSIARRSLAMAEVEDLITLEHKDLSTYEPPFEAPLILTNPPYGERLMEGPELALTWAHLGSFLKHRCSHGEAFVLCGDPELTKDLRLRATEKIPVWNGPIECRLLHYDLYPGRRPDQPATSTDQPDDQRAP